MYNLELYNNIRQWYYRGSLKSCNYSCSYCPFSKYKRCSAAELKKDEENLINFVSALLKKTAADMKKCAVQIVPYGEALIHKYYWIALACLSKSPFIEAVGAQTNLSFDIDEMADIYINNGGIARKLKLWCSFHPQMVTAEQFALQCRKLSGYGIEYCAGAAGVPLNIGYIRQLRKKLPGSIYFFINKLDGLKRNYTADEKKAFIEIDEYFELELRHHKANINRCTDILFVEADSSIRRCNICKPLAADNNRPCIRKECSCYLSYCNQSLPELFFFNPYPSFRIPHYPEAVFLDIDGIIINRNSGNTVTDKTVQWLKRLSAHSRLYFITSLPYSHAMKKAGKAGKLFSGGVFANGEMCKIQNKPDKVFPLTSVLAGKKEGIDYICSQMGYNTGEIAVFGNSAQAAEYIIY